jgi:hypothetical protein
MNAPIGYAWLQQQLQAPDFLGGWHAHVAAVQRLERLADGTPLRPHLGRRHRLDRRARPGLRANYS